MQKRVQPESQEHWPLGDKWEEAEVKEKMKVPKGSEGSRERMLEASAAEDFKKEVANRISMAKQSRMQMCQWLTTETVGNLWRGQKPAWHCSGKKSGAS